MDYMEETTMITATEHKWSLVLHIGHKYFRDLNDPGLRIAIADDSGEYPNLTDDGILWLDTEQTIKGPRYPERSFCVHLLDEDGNGTSTPATAEEAIALAALFGLRIEFDYCLDPKHKRTYRILPEN